MKVSSQRSPTIQALMSADLDPYPPVREEVIEGELDMRATVLWKSSDGRAATGIWRCSPVKLSLEHPFDETFVVYAGRMTVTPEGGAPRQLGPGDAIVLRHGSRNVWEIHTTVTKLFSIHHDGGLPV